jgi:hypothetical protein
MLLKLSTGFNLAPLLAKADGTKPAFTLSVIQPVPPDKLIE